MKEMLPLLSDLTEKSIKAKSAAEGGEVVCHCDMDSKNVLWHDGKPTVIDWEAAGLLSPRFSSAPFGRKNCSRQIRIVNFCQDATDCSRMFRCNVFEGQGLSREKVVDQIILSSQLLNVFFMSLAAERGTHWSARLKEMLPLLSDLTEKSIKGLHSLHIKCSPNRSR